MTSPTSQPTRAERRAAERAARHGERRATERAARHGERRAAAAVPTASPWRSPVVLSTFAALAVGLGIVGLLALGNIGSNGAELREPAVAVPLDLRDGRSLGSAAAPVLIEVYEDPQCPVCGRWSRDVEPLLTGDLRDGTVRLTYRDLVFIGEESVDAAVAMRAADQLAGAFWDFHALVYENQDGENKGAFSRDRLARMAETLGLDRAAFLALLDDTALRAAVAAETQQGDALGITSTPTLVLNGQVRPGLPSWAGLSATIEALAAAAGASSPTP